MMPQDRHIRASVLPTVLVVSALLMLGVLGVVGLWEQDRDLFARLGYHRQQRAHLESAFRLYEQAENLPSLLDADSSLVLYDSVPSSRVRYTVRPWGLYEAVSVESHDRRLHLSRLMGAAAASGEEADFWYADGRLALTLTGNSNLHGRVRVPQNGLAYNAMRSVFFAGERVPGHRIGRSEPGMPALHPGARELLDRIWALRGDTAQRVPITDSVTASFYRHDPAILWIGSGRLQHCSLSGQVALCGDAVEIDSTCLVRDILVVARTVRVGAGFRGRMQVVASDSVVVGQRAVLEYPSGIVMRRGLPERCVEIGPRAEVSGYVIVDGDGEADREKVNYRQVQTALVRGLLWVDGMAGWHGVVSGAVFLRRAVYNATEGYYTDLLHNATLLENPVCGYPLWAAGPYERKEVGWLP
ncbi:MAG: hypothetical protein IJC16_07740 [Rikenellaceae bacterium]|nr:hypothetical protein [Rikenellaceae bacterium]